MAKPGDILENPASGEALTVHSSTGETNGEFLSGEMKLAPHAAGPPEHVHPKIEERFRVTSGILHVKVNGVERVVTENEEVAVPPGTPHQFWNPGDGEVRFEAEARPALRLEAFLETAFGLARDGKTDRNGKPGLLQAAVLMREYSDELHLASPPLPVQKVMFGILAPIGRLLGYKAHYPQYSGEQ
jgi:mannose-6-phosphate isomerase-like protein (cupin superfamily)